MNMQCSREVDKFVEQLGRPKFVPDRNDLIAPKVGFLSLSENTRGRDWVVGDIHGAFELLEAALKMIDFDVNNDRLISCGDWVDRGPASGLSIAYLQQGWVYSVMGNHEHEWLKYFAQGRLEQRDDEKMLRSFGLDGGNWFRRLSHNDQKCFLSLIQELPFALEFQSPLGLIGVVHAEVPVSCRSWNELKRKLQDFDAPFIESVLWGRERVSEYMSQCTEDVAWVCAGHTTLAAGFRAFGNMIDLDSGAIWQQENYSDYAGLTLLDTRLGRLHQIGLESGAPKESERRTLSHFRHHMFDLN